MAAKKIYSDGSKQCTTFLDNNNKLGIEDFAKQHDISFNLAHNTLLEIGINKKAGYTLFNRFINLYDKEEEDE